MRQKDSPITVAGAAMAWDFFRTMFPIEPLRAPPAVSLTFRFRRVNPLASTERNKTPKRSVPDFGDMFHLIESERVRFSKR